MNPIPFADSNKTLTSPPNMTKKECIPLEVLDTGDQIISCWQPTPDEVEAIVNGSPVVLSIYSNAGTQPPVKLLVAEVDYSA